MSMCPALNTYSNRKPCSMCRNFFLILTPNAVVLPPNPIGPIPLLFISFSIESSSSLSRGSGFLSPNFSRSAFLAVFKARSDVPPIPTPTTIGGHGFPPAFKTVSTTKFFLLLLYLLLVKPFSKHYYSQIRILWEVL